MSIFAPALAFGYVLLGAWTGFELVKNFGTLDRGGKAVGTFLVLISFVTSFVIFSLLREISLISSSV